MNELARNGFLLHGSPLALETLWPRLAWKTFDLQEWIPTLLSVQFNYPDGRQAISATDQPDIAIFRALVHPMHEWAIDEDHASSYQVCVGHVHYAATKCAVSRMRAGHTRGYVHVVTYDDFVPRRGSQVEARAYRPVVPLEIIPVDGDDFSEVIETL